MKLISYLSGRMQIEGIQNRVLRGIFGPKRE
jgi:hypothetical protein